jgi:hypothetical protein
VQIAHARFAREEFHARREGRIGVDVNAAIRRDVELAVVGRDHQRRVRGQLRHEPGDHVVHIGRRVPPLG